MEKGVKVRKCCYVCQYMREDLATDRIYCELNNCEIKSLVKRACDDFKLWEQLELED